MEVMREYRETWAVVRAAVAICPSVVPQGVPEALRFLPAIMIREIVVTKRYQHKTFGKELGAKIAAPIRNQDETLDLQRLITACGVGFSCIRVVFSLPCQGDRSLVPLAMQPPVAAMFRPQCFSA